MVSDDTLERWGFSLDRHQHYSPPTQAAVYAFQKAFATWQSLQKSDWTASVQWASKAQEAWNRLVRYRREETGNPMYLTPEQYEEARREHAG